MLSHLTVLELASVLAGPSAGQFFAEQGALVIKVESLQGDVTRSWKTAAENPDVQVSAYFASASWGKKSIALDLSRPEAKAIIYRLLPKVDVVISSFKPGDADKLGMSDAILRQHHPLLIHGAITGYGSGDSRVAYDAILQAESGFMSMNGTPESGPVKMPVALIDILASHQLKEALLLALLKKEKTGEGSYVEVSLLQTALASLANQATNYAYTGQIPQRTGSLHPNIAPYGEVFSTKDNRLLMLAVGTDVQFSKLLHVLDLEEIAADLRFATNKSRVRNREPLAETLKKAIAEWESTELVSKLNDFKVPAGLVNDVQQALGLPQAEGILLESDQHYGLRQAVFAGSERLLSPPPVLGAGTREILKDMLGMGEAEIDMLKEKNIIG